MYSCRGTSLYSLLHYENGHLHTLVITSPVGMLSLPKPNILSLFSSVESTSLEAYKMMTAIYVHSLVIIIQR